MSECQKRVIVMTSGSFIEKNETGKAVEKKDLLSLHPRFGQNLLMAARNTLLNNQQNLQLKGSNPMNHYETVFILTPVLSDAQVKETVEAVKAELTSNDATIVNEEAWGMKKLAYPIEKKSTGFYFLLEFDGEGAIVKKLETYFRRQDRVIRFIIVKNDKYAAEYAEKRRSLKAAKAQEA